MKLQQSNSVEISDILWFDMVDHYAETWDDQAGTLISHICTSMYTDYGAKLQAFSIHFPSDEGYVMFKLQWL